MEHRILAGHDTALRSYGSEGEDQRGLRMVLALHCSLAHGGAWYALAERLSGTRMIAPDLPGHGDSADFVGGDLHGLSTRIATALAEELAAQSGGPVDVFGHSFGATVALRLALARPDLVRSLVLAEPVLFAAARGTPAWDGYAVEHQGITAAMVAGRHEDAAAMFHGLWGTGIPLARLPERQRRYIVERMPLIEVLNPDLVEDRAGLLAQGGLERLTQPVLLAQGNQSPAVVEAINAALAARLPRVQRLRIEGAGHMMPLTHAGQFAPHVQAHLDAPA